MKLAVCELCGKETGGRVPDDATGVTCFQCNEWRPYPSALADELKFGAFESHPCVYDDREGWVLFEGWKRINLAEIQHTVRPVTEAEFKRTYERTKLPPLPRGAFA
jgi:hypothetical protein